MDKYLYSLEELNQKSEEELDKMLEDHGYDLTDFVDKSFRVEVLSNLLEG